MSKPLTMTEQRKADIEHAIDHPSQADMDGEMHTFACNLWGEVDALRAALAAAEAALADERRHADALLNALHNPDNITVERAIEAHHARRAAEVE